MKKAELIDAISAKSGQGKKDVAAVLDALAEVAAESLKSGVELSIPGLARFEVKEKGPRMVRNPRTGETKEVGASRGVAVKAAKGLKDAVAVAA